MKILFFAVKFSLCKHTHCKLRSGLSSCCGEIFQLWELYRDEIQSFAEKFKSQHSNLLSVHWNFKRSPPISRFNVAVFFFVIRSVYEKLNIFFICERRLRWREKVDWWKENAAKRPPIRVVTATRTRVRSTPEKWNSRRKRKLSFWRALWGVGRIKTLIDLLFSLYWWFSGSD